MGPDESREYRGEDAARYESQAAEVAWHGHEILFGLMYEFIAPGETLLDVGIGTGLSSLLFHKAGLVVSGFDNSADMLRGCESKGFAGETIEHDLREVLFPYQADSFDHIISLAVLNFFPDLETVIKEASRIIKPQRIFGFAVEEKKAEQSSWYTMRVESGPGEHEEPFDVTLYRHSDAHVRALSADEGFSALKDFEFLADRYPEQGIDVYLKVYIAQKAQT